MPTQPTDRYAPIARWYDPATRFFLARARERVVRLCSERGFSRVLDIGCGTGVLAAALHNAGFAVTCADSSPSMLALAKGRLNGTIPLVRAGFPLPFEQGAFDAAVLALVLHESDDDPAALLAESLRVAPVAVVLDWRMPERNLDLLARPAVHAIERLAGKVHYARFRDFARNGYLRGIAARVGAGVLAETPLAAGALVLAEVIRI